MRKYYIGIAAPKGELERIMDDLDAAQKTIRDCYNRLEELGVLTMTEKEEAASGN